MSTSRCAALVRGARAPATTTQAPPAWLRPTQHASWSRACAALRGWDTAVLAEPVGSGKTWIALAVAHAFGERPMVLLPAVLRSQWILAGARSGIEVDMHTLEAMSRGRIPATDNRLVIIDEAHRLRDPATRRAGIFARWALGRRLLFLTGTPIVNRVDDLITLLRYGVPRDALRLDGIPDLEGITSAPRPPAGLRRLVIRAVTPPQVRTRRRRVASGAAEQRRAATVVTLLGRAHLSGHPGIRRLIQSVLLDAAASSDAAWRAALCRYRALLHQAQDAGGLDRRLLRQWAGASLDQTVLWALCPPAVPAEDRALIAHDLAWVEQALAAPTDDREWLEDVTALCRDGEVTICFTRHRATALALRAALGDATAWVDGAAAGIGPHRLSRDLVLAAFGPTREAWTGRRAAPRVLVATDVAAEGLDLQAASRVIHLDMPWTPMRRDQRDGRVRRLGQHADSVQLWHRSPAPSIEAMLSLGRTVRRKSVTSRRWLRVLAGSDRPRRARYVGCCVLRHDDPRAERWEAMVAFHASDGRRQGLLVLGRRDGTWMTTAWPPRGMEPREGSPSCDAVAQRAAELLPEAAAAAMTQVASVTAVPPHRLARIQRLARLAARLRDREALAALDAWLQLARRGGPSGMPAWWDEADLAPDATWCRPPEIRPWPVERPIIEPIAVALFQSPATPLR